MAILIRPYQEQHEPAVHDFNQRLLAGGVDRNLVFYARSVPRWLAKTDDCDLYNEYFVAVEGEASDGQRFALSAGFLHPVIDAAGSVAAVTDLRDDAFQLDLARVLEHLSAVDFKAFAELDVGPVDGLLQMRRSAAAFEGHSH